MSTNGDRPGADDEPDHDEDEHRLPGPRAAYAVNWKTVLAVDAAMGLVVVVAGFVALVAWNFYLGAFLSLVGCIYVALVARRANQWRALRRDVGL